MTHLLLMALLFAAPPADEVRAAETAFAKAFADRDSATFFSYLLDDSTFLGGKQTMNGRAEVVKVWSEFFKDPKAPFSWKPERVVTNAAGDIGLSTGPVYNAEGKHISDYSSIWQKQKDGSWKIVFDGPGSRVCP